MSGGAERGEARRRPVMTRTTRLLRLLSEQPGAWPTASGKDEPNESLVGHTQPTSNPESNARLTITDLPRGFPGVRPRRTQRSPRTRGPFPRPRGDHGDGRRVKSRVPCDREPLRERRTGKSG